MAKTHEEASLRPGEFDSARDSRLSDHWIRRLSLWRHGDLLLAAMVVSIVGMMIVPLPTWLLDILIATNIAIAVVLLLVSIYVSEALKIASFPSILLITTLFRLGLNISAARLILLQADAGTVIYSFGNFVVAGNLVVGAVVFLILALVQFIVIAKGSERVAEVAARFALDALPGKQLAIDADVRAGTIDRAEAIRQRTRLQRESQLYGSMDGAMKFVKGDAIAGLVIICINIVGGLFIGVLQHGMPIHSALETYSILTVGDGLVSQIPALLISTAAGIVVTRVASEDEVSHLGFDIGKQIVAHPRALGAASALLLVLALVPGLPTVPFLALSLIVGGVAYASRQTRLRSQAGRSEPLENRAQSQISLHFGKDLASQIGGQAGVERIRTLIAKLADQLYDELGVVLPHVSIHPDSPLFAAQSYEIRLAGVPLCGGEIRSHVVTALADQPELSRLGFPQGRPAVVPGLIGPATDLPDTHVKQLHTHRVPVVTAESRMALHLADAVRAHAADLIGIQEAQELLTELAKSQPALVNEVVPKLISLGALCEVLKRLLAEKLPIANLSGILGALATAQPSTSDAGALAELARMSLRRYITHAYAAEDGAIHAYVFDPLIEQTVRDSITARDGGGYLAIEPELSRDIVQAVQRRCERHRERKNPVVLLTAADIRRFVRQLLTNIDLPVLSFGDLLPTTNVVQVDRIRVDEPT